MIGWLPAARTERVAWPCSAVASWRGTRKASRCRRHRPIYLATYYYVKSHYVNEPLFIRDYVTPPAPRCAGPPLWLFR